MTTPPVKNSIDRSSWRRGFVLIPLAFAIFAIVPGSRAVSPPPDGFYPGQNTAEGQQALFSLTTGVFNTAVGFHALFLSNGSHNTATGSQAQFSNTGGGNNTATGDHALFLNKTGFDNTADGFQALYNGTNGFNNTAMGYQALYSNTGTDNTGVGY